MKHILSKVTMVLMMWFDRIPLVYDAMNDKKLLNVVILWCIKEYVTVQVYKVCPLKWYSGGPSDAVTLENNVLM